MIESITVRNFKSLVDVTLHLGKFNCLIGMNGTGKSTLLQVIDFIAQQMHGDIDGWLESRGWNSKDLYSRTGDPRASHQGIMLFIQFRMPDGQLISWGGGFNRANLKFMVERTWIDNALVLEVSKEQYRIGEQEPIPVAFKYQGSILSQLEDKVLPEPIRLLRDAIRGLRSLELLSPHLLRKRSRAQDKDIGAGGEKLSGFLDTIKGDAKARLVELLKQFYPRLLDFRIATAKGGWKRLVITESRVITEGLLAGSESSIETDASQLNDGLLRILAMLAQATSSNTSMLLLDEVENGINPEIVEKLVDTLVSSQMQMIVTTHSPMILNYLTDDLARQAVQFVYKSPSGQTRIRNFFNLPRVGDKLSYMGPGEAFVDTNLEQLTKECVEQDHRDALAKAAKAAVVSGNGGPVAS